MLTDPEAMIAYLESLGIDATTHRHAPVFTVEEAKRRPGTCRAPM